MLKRFLLLVLLVPSMVSPFVSYTLLEKGEKSVLILGDMHNYQIDQMNNQHCDILKQAVCQFKGINKINCLLEIDRVSFEIATQKKDYCVDKHCLGKFAGKGTFESFLEEVGNDQFFNIVPADERSRESLFIFKTFKIIEILLFKNINNIEQLKKEAFNFDAFKKACKLNASNDILLGRYLEILDMNLKSALKLLDAYKGTEYYQSFATQVEELQNSINELETQIGSYALNKPIHEFMCDYLKECKYLKAVQEKFNFIKKLFTNPNSIYSDIFCFALALKDQSINKKTFLCIGNAHARNLKNAFESIGYETIMYNSCSVLHPDGSSSIQNSQEFEDGFVGLFKKFFESSSVLPKKCNTVAYNCNFCNLEDRDVSFKKCSGCKLVHYCSVKCQQNDWPLHKYICKWVTGRHKLELIQKV